MSETLEFLEQRRAELETELEAINSAITAYKNPRPIKKGQRPRRRRRKPMSEATKKKISRAMKKRHRERKSAS